MIYEIYIPTGLIQCIIVLTFWFLAPLLLRIKTIMVGKRRENVYWIISSILLCAPYLAVTFAFRSIAIIMYTLYEWSMSLAAKMLGAIIPDEKP